MTVWRGPQEAVPRKEAWGRMGVRREQKRTPDRALSLHTPVHCFLPGSGVILSGRQGRRCVRQSSGFRLSFPACRAGAGSFTPWNAAMPVLQKRAGVMKAAGPGKAGGITL